MWPYDVRKPVIAAISDAVGVGITYPMTCDIRYVAQDAKLAFVLFRRGAIPELASHAIVPRVAGFAVAAHLLLSGRTFLGSEAVALGLVTAALPAEEVLPTALATAHDIAANTAPVSVAVAKRLLWSSMDQSVHATERLESALFPRSRPCPTPARASPCSWRSAHRRGRGACLMWTSPPPDDKRANESGSASTRSAASSAAPTSAASPPRRAGYDVHAVAAHRQRARRQLGEGGRRDEVNVLARGRRALRSPG